MNLVTEARPEDSEVKSEAAFQRLLASCAELPTPTRSARAQDRGRYPEEAGQDDSQHEQTGSDDDGEDDEIFEFSNNNDSITTTKSSTSNGDDFPVPESPSFPMEIDMVRFHFVTTEPRPYARRSQWVPRSHLHQIIGDILRHQLPVPHEPISVNVSSFLTTRVLFTP